MLLEWDQTIATGINVIDDQHKVLFRLINDVFEICQGNQCSANVKKVFNTLENYIVHHFNAEEAIQIKTKYPDYKFHKTEHGNFVDHFLFIQSEFVELGSSPDLIKQLKSLLVDWLLQHIEKQDKKLAGFLHSFEREHCIDFN